jgi:hypothetical protein
MPVEIPLTRGFMALVDPADAADIFQYSWRVSLVRGHVYALRTDCRAPGAPKTVFMHRQIMDAPPDLDVDHWDDNGLNNTRDNLRILTTGANIARSRSVRNQYGYRGVTCRGELFYGRVVFDRWQYYTAGFDTPADAARAREPLLISLFGKVAISHPLAPMVEP